MSLSSDIKEYALEIGFDRVGITNAETFPVLERELTERREMYTWAIEGSQQLLKSIDPHNFLPEAQSIIVAVFDYYKQAFPVQMIDKIGRCYLAYGARPIHPINSARNELLRKYLQSRGLKVADNTVRPPARLCGARAGVINYGKNCFAFADGIGSFIQIETFIVDTELEYDRPTFEVKCPPQCTLCIDACPTRALYAPLKMDPRRCIAYNSFATPGSHYNPSYDIIPADIRENMGSWIYGCDVCQQVCPHNQAKIKAKLPPNAYLELLANEFRLENLLSLSDAGFNRISMLLHYIKNKSYFQRNAAVAMGNLKNDEFVPALTKVLTTPETTVRGHAAWALGKIGGAAAKKILETSLAKETSDYVLREITAALSR